MLFTIWNRSCGTVQVFKTMIQFCENQVLQLISDKKLWVTWLRIVHNCPDVFIFIFLSILNVPSIQFFWVLFLIFSLVFIFVLTSLSQLFRQFILLVSFYCVYVVWQLWPIHVFARLCVNNDRLNMQVLYSSVCITQTILVLFLERINCIYLTNNTSYNNCNKNALEENLPNHMGII